MKGAVYLTAVVLGLYATCARASQDGVVFDISALKTKGVSEAVANYFSKAPRFAPGTSYVGLYVNGVKLGTTSVTFDEQGQLCVDGALLDRAGIAWPDTKAKNSADNACLDLHKAWPTATVTLRPGLNQVELLVPPQALTAAGSAPVYVTGGRAAMFNYRLFDVRSTGLSKGTNTFYADLESGLNVGDWVLRSHDMYSGNDERRTFQHVQAYVQKTFVSYKSTAQFGQLDLNNTLFSAPSFTGVQAFPEGALAPANSGTSVSGIAQTPARVEIRQSGMLIYSTLVPAGPFTIPQVPLRNSSADLQVTVVESTGEQRSFVVPAASFASNFVSAQKGVSWAVGKPRSISGDLDTLGSAWFMTATGTMPIGHANATTGLMLADRYRALGAGVDGAPVIGSNAYLRGVYARDERIGSRGERLETGLSVPLGKGWSASTSMRQQSEGYRDLTDLPDYHQTYDPQDPFKPVLVWDPSRLQFSASAGYSNTWLGGVSVGFTQSQQFHNGSTHTVNASWNRSFGKFNLSVTGDMSSGYDNDRRIYVSLSMPLGSASVSADLTHDGTQTQSSLRLNQRVNDYVSYGLSASTQTPSNQQSYTGSLSLLPKYTQLNLGVTANGAQSRSYSGSLSGGVVLDGGEPLFSPYPVQDTYAVVSASQLPGARIQTPAGPAWTDSAGRAVAASLMPYSESRLELQTKGLPRNVDVKNGIQVVEAGRGSVSHINFTAVRLRRVLLTVRDTQGQPLPTGLGVLDNSDHYLSIVGPSSQIFVDADHLKTGVFVKPENGQPCRVEATLNKQPKDAPYEQAQAVCRPIAALPHPIS